jgi:hypothetical protein
VCDRVGDAIGGGRLGPFVLGGWVSFTFTISDEEAGVVFADGASGVAVGGKRRLLRAEGRAGARDAGGQALGDAAEGSKSTLWD